MKPSVPQLRALNKVRGTTVGPVQINRRPNTFKVLFDRGWVKWYQFAPQLELTESGKEVVARFKLAKPGPTNAWKVVPC